ncbi:MAG: preprotein translocase subunit YajC [Clostridiaceae bacterium]|jgi:preprotein translocase subunit YajC|nr:preprotein translocase subunit YajC [Clostridiaceae bacterium]
MFGTTLALDTQYTMLIILGLFFVVMMVMTVIPQKKRKKQQQEMMSSLGIGTKVMTIGRMIGTIVAINNAENQIILNVGSDENPTLITIDRGAIGMVVNPTIVSASSDDTVDDNLVIDSSDANSDDTQA